ncbi:PREDICTED: uncharacterized protein LOC109128342 [Camelina sativa]|uniref:Uncharacterized protein LOC109128342 n=1 Tax=Camelina sativa TaxID=90675 RepID=A0ABM1QTI7_CAMSA|nr:PREDICTED: uncharacterized protein LOC109128342 [Camelina sativa]
MRKRNPKASDLSEPSSSPSRQEPDVVYDNDALDKEVQADVQRSGKVWFSVLILVTYFSWAVYSYQYGNLPKPLTAKQAGKRGFSEIAAMKHVKALTQFGPHPVSSDALVHALEGKSLVYSDISHIVLRILPKYESDAGDNAILVSSHIDTVFTTYVASSLIH